MKTFEHAHHQYVDLGLPSGTLWATCNVGATSPEEPGDHYCWGETRTKTYYDLSTYSHLSQGQDPYLDKSTLEPADDAAHVLWGEGWQTPSIAAFDELITHCSWLWTTMRGVTGYQVTGPNGQSIFLPAARRRANDQHGLAYHFGQYLTNALNEDYTPHAKCLFFASDSIIIGNVFRCDGSSVRPVLTSACCAGQ